MMDFVLPNDFFKIFTYSLKYRVTKINREIMSQLKYQNISDKPEIRIISKKNVEIV